jgi:hypothetical protein
VNNYSLQQLSLAGLIATSGLSIADDQSPFIENDYQSKQNKKAQTVAYVNSPVQPVATGLIQKCGPAITSYLPILKAVRNKKKIRIINLCRKMSCTFKTNPD